MAAQGRFARLEYKGGGWSGQVKVHHYGAEFESKREPCSLLVAAHVHSLSHTLQYAYKSCVWSARARPSTWIAGVASVHAVVVY